MRITIVVASVTLAATLTAAGAFALLDGRERGAPPEAAPASDAAPAPPTPAPPGATDAEASGSTDGAACLESARDGAEDPWGAWGEVRDGRSVYVYRNRTVSLDNATALRALALANALDHPVELGDVLDFREERVEICVFDRAAALDREESLVWRALAASGTSRGLDAPPDARAYVLFRTTTTQAVELDAATVVAALALHDATGAVRFEDVVTIRRESRTALDAVIAVNLTEEDALARLLASPGGTYEAGASEDAPAPGFEDDADDADDADERAGAPRADSPPGSAAPSDDAEAPSSGSGTGSGAGTPPPPAGGGGSGEEPAPPPAEEAPADDSGGLELEVNLVV